MRPLSGVLRRRSDLLPAFNVGRVRMLPDAQRGLLLRRRTLLPPRQPVRPGTSGLRQDNGKSLLTSAGSEADHPV